MKKKPKRKIKKDKIKIPEDVKEESEFEKIRCPLCGKLFNEDNPRCNKCRACAECCECGEP